MDLVASLTFTEVVTGLSLSMVIGILGTALLANIHQFWSMWASNPVVGTVVNTTLVVLKNTEVVWKPVLNASLVILKPLGSFALMILKPFGPLALIISENVVKAVVIVAYMTAHAVILLVQTVKYLADFIQSAGLNLTYAVQSFAQGTKDITYAISKIIYWVGFLLYEIVYGVGYMIDTCERVGMFLYRVLFEAHKITWNDIYNITIPFLVVAALIGIVVWRASNRCRKPYAPEKKNDEECIMPRRSSRIARKRAILLCSDMPFPSEKSSLRTPNL